MRLVTPACPECGHIAHYSSGTICVGVTLGYGNCGDKERATSHSEVDYTIDDVDWDTFDLTFDDDGTLSVSCGEHWWNTAVE